MSAEGFFSTPSLYSVLTTGPKRGINNSSLLYKVLYNNKSTAMQNWGKQLEIRIQIVDYRLCLTPSNSKLVSVAMQSAI